MPDEDIPMCGDPLCGGCPTVIQFNDLIAKRRRQDRINANVLLGLPSHFHIDEDAAT